MHFLPTVGKARKVSNRNTCSLPKKKKKPYIEDDHVANDAISLNLNYISRLDSIFSL